MTMKMTSGEMKRRKIEFVSSQTEELWVVGKQCVVEINVYDESGQCGNIPYLQIRFSDGSEIRANAANYVIGYAPPEGA